MSEVREPELRERSLLAVVLLYVGAVLALFLLAWPLIWVLSQWTVKDGEVTAPVRQLLPGEGREHESDSPVPSVGVRGRPANQA